MGFISGPKVVAAAPAVVSTSPALGRGERQREPRPVLFKAARTDTQSICSHTGGQTQPCDHYWLQRRLVS